MTCHHFFQQELRAEKDLAELAKIDDKTFVLDIDEYGHEEILNCLLQAKGECPFFCVTIAVASRCCLACCCRRRNCHRCVVVLLLVILPLLLPILTARIAPPQSGHS